MRHHTHDHTFVPATPTTIATRLPDHLDLDGLQLHLAGTTTRTETAADAPASPAQHWCTPVTWRRGRRHGAGTLEVRPAAHGWSELALRWDGPAPARRPARRRAATDTPAAALERTITGRPRPTTPPRRRPSPRRRATLASTAVTAIALIAALVVVDPFSPTAVSADDALARFRAEAEAAQAADAQVRSVAQEAPETEAPASDQDPDPEPTPDPATAPAEPAATPDEPRPAPETDAAAASAPTTDAPSSAPEADAQTTRDTADQPERPTRPAAGVYRYATDGSEELDTRGSHRRFPQQTVQTVHHTDDGFRQVWEPIEERRDEHTLSTATDPPLLVTTATSRSFFGQQRDQRFTCTPADTGARGWKVSCTDDDGTTRMTVTTRVEGTERRSVRGTDVEVVRLGVVAELSGATEGRRTSTTWTRAGDGLLVAAEVEGEVETEGPFGPVRYRESYTLDLLDLEPAR
jgi:hypothetical protein